MQKFTNPIYVGMMSGTSLDGVDAVAAIFHPGCVEVLGRAAEPYPPSLRASVRGICTPGDNEINRMQQLGNEIAKLYARAFQKLIRDTGLKEHMIRAIGAHGQTIRHAPKIGVSTQVLNAAFLAELTGVDVIADFRSRDLAAGGEGAPLVPAFHRAAFSSEKPRGILNIGGISNLTVLPAASRASLLTALPGNPDLQESDAEASKEVIGFDCGPGNILMDAWIEASSGAAFDRDGAWAKKGNVIPELLSQLKAEPFFVQKPPKSTGRELFNLQWIKARTENYEPVDVQRTLLALTAESIRDAIEAFALQIAELWVCGGGAKNSFLMSEVARLCPQLKVSTTAELGIDPQDVESIAFAWLAERFIKRLPGNLESVTGAKGPRILGALYPA